MSKLCERPGCSERGAVAYGMVPEDLLFWIAPLAEAPSDDPAVLCGRHADAMSVPRGWTLDDRREPMPRLFKSRPATRTSEVTETASLRARRSARVRPVEVVEQLQLDGTGEIQRPVAAGPVAPVETWEPGFDADDDLDGLLQVSSPLLARAFRGHGRPRP